MTAARPHILPPPGDGHWPVLLAEVLGAVVPRDGDVIVDGTFGRGGYSRAFLAAADCTVIAIDRDPAAVAAGQALAAVNGGRLTVLEGAFSRMDTLVAAVLGPDAGAPGSGGPQVDGVALDLGVSSRQLDDPERGFSFRADGPLDMRMGRHGPTAAEVVNTLSEDELARILREYGEERLARRVARAIVAARAAAPLRRTLELAELVRRVVPPARDGIDPATRTFQALRIYVNDELGELDRGLGAAERLLRPGGRLAVVAFHSLEDRIVKRFLTERSGADPAGSRHLPPAAARPAPTFRLAQRKPVTPGEAECIANPRARSARLRAAFRTAAPAWPDAPNRGAAA